MDEFSLYNLITLFSLRAIVSTVYFERYLRRKDKKNLYLTVSWLFFSLSPLSWLLSNMTENLTSELLFITSGSLAASSTVAIFIFIVLYFEEYNIDYRLFGTLIAIFLSNYVLFALDMNEESVFLTLSFQTVAVVSFFLYVIIKYNTIQKIVGSAIYWIYLVTFFSLVQVISTVLVGTMTEELRVITVINTFLLAQMLQSIEHNISTRTKYLLKDKYSHDITNMLQTVEMATSLALNKENLSEFTKKKFKLVQEEIEQSAELLRKIREL